MMDTAEVVKVKDAGTAEKTRETIFNELRNDFADWMMAKQDLVWRPVLELTKEGNEFAARALVPGVELKDLEVLIAPEILLIKGEMPRGESGYTKLLTSVRFPEPVNPARVHAEIRDGMLSVRAEIANAWKVVIFRPRAA